MIMKKMTGIRLINWHAFQNETIKIYNSVLLSGENGAGKSTVLDAIQYVLTCSKSNFNKAANESGKRDLEGYVRYKTGKEDRAFERSGNVTSHVALEFYEEKRKEYFIIGTVIDSASETSSKSLFYRIEGEKLEDIEFIKGDNTPRDINDFKVYGKSLKIQSFNQPSQARDDFRNRLGNYNNKFFELLPKALAFKPLGNVKEFVYSYILDEKEVNIENLRQNIRTYREFEELLDEIKLKISRLKDIKAIYEEYEKHKKNVKLQGYIISRAEEEKLINQLEYLKNDIEKNELKLKMLIAEKTNEENLKKHKEDLKTDLNVELNSNGDYKAVKGIDSKIYNLKEKLKEEEKILVDFKALVKKQKDLFTVLSRKYDEYYTEFIEALNVLNYENSEEFCFKALKAEEYILKRKDYISVNKGKLTNKIDEINRNLSESKNKIEELKKRNLQYPSEIKYLKEVIIEESKKEGKVITPKILCEVIEITDPKWTDAIEGYLNTQRFYFIVESNEFDRALKIYERYRKQKNIYNAGIINTAGLDKYDTCDENSLANVVTSKSRDAKRFINSILGKVIRCNNVESLKNYRSSITATCMVYKNHVARAIDPRIYKTPYIGAEAYKIQLEQEEKKFEALKDEFNDINDKIKVMDGENNILSATKVGSLIEKQEILAKVNNTKNQLKEFEEQKKQLEKNSSYIDIQLKLQSIEDEIEECRIKIKKIDDKEIACRTAYGISENEIKRVTYSLKLKEEEVDNISTEIGELKEEGENKFQKAKSKRSYEEIITNFNKAKVGVINNAKNTEKNLEDNMRIYNNTYNFGAEVGVGGINTFIVALDELEKSKVIEYEEKVKAAKSGAEEEFKYHFIAKLKENIEKARSEIKELNRGLKGIYFGKEAYEFIGGKSKELNKYHDMVMHEENIAEGFNLFTDMYQSEYKELLDELFEKLTLDDSNSELELRKFTDYRNYMDYDIRINHSDGTHSLFSKVSKEKSGGETQTPFYVVIAASFLQLYKSSLKESIGLILFDEAFDKMDDVRIVAMMEFFKKLDLQVIIGAPPQKIEAIAPYVNTTLLAMKLDKFSIIEEHKHGGL